MVTLTLLVTAALATTSHGFNWNKCTNADPCKQNNVMMSSQLYTSGQVDFIYDGSNGYWYAHKETGIFVSPAGYFQYAHGKKYLDVFSKDSAYAGTSWIANTGSACCLPDEVGTGIKDLRAFSG